MTEPDPVAEVRALAETLHAAIRELNDRVDERAREIAAKDDVFLLAQRMGQSMRDEMIAKVSDDDEARNALVSVPAEAWTSSAARLLSTIYADIAWQERARNRRRREPTAQTGNPHPEGQSSGGDT